MVAGRELTPKDAESPAISSFDRCVVELGKYVNPGIVKGLCSNLHKRATGARPGHAASEQDGHH